MRVSRNRFLAVLILHLGSIAQASALADATPSPTPPVVIAPNGTVQVTRVVPVPSTISAEAQSMLSKLKPSAQSHQTVQEHRAATDKWQTEMGEKSLKLYPVKLTTDIIAGIRVRIVTPPTIAPEKASRVLINLHGGGFRVDSGSLSETIPIANLTGTKVIPFFTGLHPKTSFPQR